MITLCIVCELDATCSCGSLFRALDSGAMWQHQILCCCSRAVWIDHHANNSYLHFHPLVVHFRQAEFPFRTHTRLQRSTPHIFLMPNPPFRPATLCLTRRSGPWLRIYTVSQLHVKSSFNPPLRARGLPHTAYIRYHLYHIPLSLPLTHSRCKPRPHPLTPCRPRTQARTLPTATTTGTPATLARAAGPTERTTTSRSTTSRYLHLFYDVLF
jgi:hypothetical protein